jgi:hypothetical protein
MRREPTGLPQLEKARSRMAGALMTGHGLIAAPSLL